MKESLPNGTVSGLRHTGKQKFITMRKTLIIISAAAALLGFGCKKESETIGCQQPTKDFEYFIFGTAYGECIGDCAKIFQLQGQQLFADDGLEYFLYKDVVPFQTTSLSAEKIAIAKELLEQFPLALLDEANGSVGCPDCRDQGMIFIKIKVTCDEARFWFIDPDEAKYAEFYKAVREAAEKMQ